MEKINELLRAELACLISRNIALDNGLITISHVKCSPNLLSATVFISVLPENQTGTALSNLRKQNSSFTKKLKKLNLKNIPKFNWRVDSQIRHAAEIDKVFKEARESD